MGSGSATTRSFRSRISFERGPGTAVRSSIAFVAAITLDDNAAGGRCAYLYREVSEGLGAERLHGVQPGGVPEHEAFDVLQPRRLDLVLDVGEGVGPAEREVLEPRHELRLSVRDLGPEVAERVRHGRAGPRIGVDD